MKKHGSRLWWLGILILVCSACSENDDPPPYTPNIIHIMADDLAYGEIGAFGQQLIQTPNLDQLAREGMRFTQHYAGSSLCSPSRWALFTGQHAGTSGVIGNGRNDLQEGQQTIASLLHDNGYTTAMIGKWAQGAENTSGYPPRQGFDTWFGYATQGDAHNYYPELLHDNAGTVALPGNIQSEHFRVAAVKTTYAPDMINQRALEFIRDSQSVGERQPFYLQLHYNLPHINNELLQLTGDGMEYPGVSRYENLGWELKNSGYAEMVSLVDDYVGAVTDELVRLGISEDTLVIFTSDNGATGARGEDSLEFFNSNAGFRGYKGSLFETAIRVPMIAWWPGKIAGDTSTDYPTTFWDMLPTMLQLAQAPPSSSTDGISLVRLLLNGQQPSAERSLFWQVENWLAARQGDWKLVQWTGKPAPQEFLYDLAADPGETSNQIREQPEIADRMRALAVQLNTSGAHWEQ